MNYILVRFMDIFRFIVSILAEDINWLSDYLRTLTNTECLLFFILLIGYTLLMKYLIALIKFALRFFVMRARFVAEKFMSKDAQRSVLLNSLDYCRGYDKGYQAGYDKYEEEERRRRASSSSSSSSGMPWYKKILPWNWF